MMDFKMSESNLHTVINAPIKSEVTGSSNFMLSDLTCDEYSSVVRKMSTTLT